MVRQRLKTYRPLSYRYTSPIVRFAKRTGPYAGIAALGAEAYANRQRLMAAIRNPYKRFKRVLRPKQRVYGTKSTATRFMRHVLGETNSWDALVRKTLYARKIKFCEEPSASLTSPLRRAVTNSIYVSGMKMCMKARNRSIYPIKIHMAIVQLKEEPDEHNTNDTSELKPDFFRDSAGTEKYLDFFDVTQAPVWDDRQDCYPLNSRKFNVLTHRKFYLDPNNDRTVSPNLPANDVAQVGRSFMDREFWIPIKKKFEFAHPASTVQGVTKPLIYLVWYDTLYPSTSDESTNVSMCTSFNTYSRNVT